MHHRGHYSQRCQGYSKDFDNDDSSNLMQHDLSEVETLHECSIAHRDIKLGNSLINHAWLAMTVFDASYFLNKTGYIQAYPIKGGHRLGCPSADLCILCHSLSISISSIWSLI